MTYEVVRAVDPESPVGRKDDTERLGRLLAEGWEPFAAVTQGMQGTGQGSVGGFGTPTAVWIYLRRAS